MQSFQREKIRASTKTIAVVLGQGNAKETCKAFPLRSIGCEGINETRVPFTKIGIGGVDSIKKYLFSFFF